MWLECDLYYSEYAAERPGSAVICRAYYGRTEAIRRSKLSRLIEQVGVCRKVAWNIHKYMYVALVQDSSHAEKGRVLSECSLSFVMSVS